MSIFAIGSIIAFLIYLNFFLDALTRSMRLRWVYAAMCAALATRSIFFAFLYDAPTRKAAFQWFKLSNAGWAIFPAITLHFFLDMTGVAGGLLRKRYLALLYLTGIAFVAHSFSCDLGAQIDFVRTPYGVWSLKNTHNFVIFVLFNIYFVGSSLACLWLAWKWSGSSTNNREKLQARVLMITTATVFVIGLTTDIVLPLLVGHDWPLMTHITLIIWVYGVWYARTMYRFMAPTLEVASDAIVSRVTDLLALISIEGKILRVNNSFIGVCCRPESEVIGSDYRSYFDMPGIGEIRERLGGASSSFEYETDFISFAHGRIPVSVSVASISGEYGDAVGILLCARDMRQTRRLMHEIEVRNSMEARLRESEERYRELVENANDIIYTAELGGRFLTINRTAERLTGYTTAEILQLNIFDLVLPEYRDVIRSEVELKTKRLAHRDRYEIKLRNKRGEIMTFEISATVKFRNGVPVESHGIARDVTERCAFEESLRKSEFKYREFADSLPQIVYECDLGGRLTFINRAAFGVFGYTREDVEKGINVLQSLHPDCRERATAKISALIAGTVPPEKVGDEYVMVRKNGTAFPAFVHSYAFFDNGRPAGLRGIIIDVSHLKNVENELRKAQEELERKIAERTAELASANEQLKHQIVEREKMEAELIKVSKLESVSVLAGGIAHDFNNFLTAIITNLSLARAYSRREDKLLETIGRAEEVAFRSRELTAQLLTFARGGKPLRKVAGIGELITSTAEFTVRGSGIKCEIEIQTGLRNVNIDEGQMNQVFTNLIINAVQAMPEGGTITAGARNETIGDGGAVPPGEYVAAFVADTGVGIAEGDLVKIFDPYYTTKPRGNGLGLASVYSIVRNHDGHVIVESEPGKGARFTVYLPAVFGDAAERAVKAGGIVKGLRGRVLVMDDEEVICSTVCRILEKWGLETVGTRDGAAAVEEFTIAHNEGRPFDLVITDLTVPGGMGGLDAVARLLAVRPDAKIVASSGYFNGPVTSEYEKYGFSAFLAKPFRLEELNSTVAGLLPARD